MKNLTDARFEILKLDNHYSVVLIDLKDIFVSDQEIAIYRILKKIKRLDFEISVVKNFKTTIFDFSIPPTLIESLENYQVPLFLVKKCVQN